jgi:transposase-like protein
MKFFEFCSLVSSDVKVLQYLQDQALLKKSINCERCGLKMVSQYCGRALDGVCFRCTGCKSKRSIRSGSFLENSKLSLRVFVSIVFFLQTETLLKHIAEILELSVPTVIDYANLIREQYGKFLLQKGEKLGGIGVRVQVSFILLNSRSMKV